jgi:hypothetical protein
VERFVERRKEGKEREGVERSRIVKFVVVELELRVKW